MQYRFIIIDMGARKRKNVGGRPTKMVDAVLRKLEEAFSWDWSDAKACDYAGICPATLYEYQKNNPAFQSRKEMLKGSPLEVARKNVANAVYSGDVRLSQWILERRDANYSLKNQVDVKVQHSIDPAMVAGQLQQLLDNVREKQQAAAIAYDTTQDNTSTQDNTIDISA